VIIELKEKGSSLVCINTDSLCFIKKQKEGSKLSFSNGKEIIVSESYATVRAYLKQDEKESLDFRQITRI